MTTRTRELKLTLRKPGGGGGDGQSQGLLRLEDFGWKSFDVGEVLGTGRSRTVFKAAFQGEEVAVKLCDL